MSKPTEVYDTERQKELVEQAKVCAFEERQRVKRYQQAQRDCWRRLIGRTVVRVEQGPGDALRLTLDNEKQFFVMPSEWATYSFEPTELDYITEQEWKDVLA